MLFRSASSLILKSCVSRSSTESKPGIPVRKACSVSVSIYSGKKIPKTSANCNLEQFAHVSNRMYSNHNQLSFQDFIEEKGDRETRLAFSEGVVLDDGWIVGGGANDGGGGGDRFWDYGKGGESSSMDEYYKKMIQVYPGDSLLLANYAKFLKQVLGDLMKAEEYCERAILEKGDDGNMLSLYGDLIWNNHKDTSRAQAYFDHALHSSPDDCYVVASYARFIWEAGEEDDENEADLGDDAQNNITISKSLTATS